MSSVEYNLVSPFYLKKKKSLLTELFACGKNGLININLSIKLKKGHLARRGGICIQTQDLGSRGKRIPVSLRAAWST